MSFVSRDEAISLAKTTFKAIAKRALLGGLASLGPIGANPFSQAILSSMLDPILTFLVDYPELLVFFKFIDWRVAHQNKEFQSAAFKNHEVQKNGTKEEKIKAEKELWDAAANFIRINT